LRRQSRQQPICNQGFLVPQGIQLLAGFMAEYALGTDTFDQLLVLLIQLDPPAQIINALIAQPGCCEFSSLSCH
jgi:hypothetical protein